LKYALRGPERKQRKNALKIVDKYERYTSEDIKLHGISTKLQIFCCVKEMVKDPKIIFQDFEEHKKDEKSFTFKGNFKQELDKEINLF
jgi:hypothetical protein